MDRLEDLHRISRIYVPSDANYEIIASSKTTTHEHRNSTPIIVPPFLKLAISLFTHLEFNDQLKDRMLTL